MSVDLVIKLGGGVLSHAGLFAAALAAIGQAASVLRLLVVPGGGPFADTVREVDRVYELPDSAAHWMAILAMDQYAHVIASRLSAGVIVVSAREIDGALTAGKVPVLAPSSWLRAADPLPHSWEVTSDSIAAWVAGQVGARRLVLIKPPGATGGDLVDAQFHQTVPPGVTAVALPAEAIAAHPELLLTGPVVED